MRVAWHYCPQVLLSGMTPLSSVPLLRRDLWHPTMHAWCTTHARTCVAATFLAALRLDRSAAARPDSSGTDVTDDSDSTGTSCVGRLPHDMWLVLLQFVRRDDFGPSTD